MGVDALETQAQAEVGHCHSIGFHLLPHLKLHFDVLGAPEHAAHSSAVHLVEGYLVAEEEGLLESHHLAARVEHAFEFIQNLDIHHSQICDPASPNEPLPLEAHGPI